MPWVVPERNPYFSNLGGDAVVVRFRVGLDSGNSNLCSRRRKIFKSGRSKVESQVLTMSLRIRGSYCNCGKVFMSMNTKRRQETVPEKMIHFCGFFLFDRWKEFCDSSIQQTISRSLWCIPANDRFVFPNIETAANIMWELIVFEVFVKRRTQKEY